MMAPTIIAEIDMRHFIVLIVCLFAAGAISAAEIQQWQVPWADSRPRDPDVGPDGRIWFVGQGSDYVAVFDPSTEEFKRFDLGPGTGPHNLIVGDDGTVWFAGNQAGYIGRLNSGNGQIEQIAMPDARAKDPHTLVFDGRGNIWFTLQQSNMIGRLAMESGEVDLVAVKTPRARPYGILVDDHGRPWIVLFGANKLATIDPATLLLTEIEMPRQGARPRRIGRTEDGRIWYVDYQEGYLGAYDPANQTFEEWPAPAGGKSAPYAMAVDDQNRIWFVETYPEPNVLVGFDSKTARYISQDPIASGAGSVRHMVFDGNTNTLWFGTDNNTLARARLP